MEFAHVSVLLEECIEGLQIKPNGIYVDCTLGGGGHSSHILSHLQEDGLLIGFDQDEDALQAARAKIGDAANFVTIHSNFRNLKSKLLEIGITKVDGILFDLGVSSYQLDEPERGFSYMHDAPLDMRMNRTGEKISAYNLVNELAEKELADIIWKNGEEKWSKRIANFIVAAREKEPIKTTGELVSIIKAAIPVGARQDGSHPAKRTFQALRIAVNQELEILEKTIEDAVDVLNPQGRLAIITFHSLEDRIVKNKFKDLAGGCTCPPGFPVCICGQKPVLKIKNRKPLLSSGQELEKNPRARSAKLRIAEKI